MRRWLPAALLLALLVPPASAAVAGPRAALVVYDGREAGNGDLGPPGDLQGVPATRVDGVLRADDAPEGNPASSAAHYRELQRLLDERSAAGSPIVLELDGTLAGGALRVALNATAARTDIDLGNVRLRVAIVQDGNGTVRDRAERQLLAASGPLPLSASVSIPTSSAWDLPRVRVVAWTMLSSGEVAQAATWSVGQDGATRQVAKLPLVEHVTAADCEPCVPRDEAIALLAGAGDAASGKQAYFVAPSALGLVGLVAGGGVGAWLALRRRAA